jgi:hypothetical protein
LTAFELSAAGSQNFSMYGGGIVRNAYYNGTNFIYKASSLASLYEQASGQHRWYTAPSGTAGDPITFGDAKMTLDASGNLGVGTTSPAYRLQVETASATADVVGYFRQGSGAVAAILSATDLVGFGNGATSGETRIYADGASGLVTFRTAATERARITAAGDLYVGATSGARGGSATRSLFKMGSGQVYFELQAETTSTDTGLVFSDGSSGNYGLIGYSSTDIMQFYTASNERARITAAGDFLVGSTSPAIGGNERFSVLGTRGIGVKSTGSATDWPCALWNSAASGDNLWVIFYSDAAGITRGSIDYNRAGGLVRYNTTSDYRAKDIIGPLQNVGETIDGLKVYEGIMKGATESRPMLIAHEAQEYAPYAVSGVKDEVNEDGTPKFQQIDVSSLVPLLLAEIQSLRARVAALEAK